MNKFSLVLVLILSTLLPRIARAYEIVRTGNGICTTSTPVEILGAGGRTVRVQPRWRCSDPTPAMVTGANMPAPGAVAQPPTVGPQAPRQPATGAVAVRTAARPPVIIPPSPGGAWERIWPNGSRFPRSTAAPAPVEEPTPPPPAPLAALPRTDVFQLRMQFVNFRGVRVNESLPPQGAFCVARTLEDALIDRMTDAQRAERCREWSTALETNGANEYAAPFLLARDGTWVVTRYARVAIGERPWHTQRFQHIDATTSIVQLFPDDVRSGEHDDPPIVVQNTHRLPPSAVASRGHRRGSHAHPRARRSHRGCCLRRACR